jgi:hypothetical protein
VVDTTRIVTGGVPASKHAPPKPLIGSELVAAMLRFLIWIISIALTALTGAFGKRWLGNVWEIAMIGLIAIIVGLVIWAVIDWKRGR